MRFQHQMKIIRIKRSQMKLLKMIIQYVLNLQKSILQKIIENITKDNGKLKEIIIDKKEGFIFFPEKNQIKKWWETNQAFMKIMD